LLDQLAAAPNTVSRQIGPQVEILAEARQTRVAGFRYREDRAWFGIGLGKSQEIMCQLVGQNHQIGLHVAGRQSRGGPGEIPRPDPPTLTRAGCDTPLTKSAHPAFPTLSKRSSATFKCQALHHREPVSS